MMSPAYWLEIPVHIRAKMAEEFKIPKSGIIQVVSNKVDSDGYSARDLQALTVEKLQKFTQSTETDFYKLVSFQFFHLYEFGYNHNYL